MTTVAPGAGAGDTGEDGCVAIAVPNDSDRWEIHTVWFIIALIIGLVVGAIIALICAYLCFRDSNRKEWADSYEEEERFTGYDTHKAYDDNQAIIANGHATPKKKKGRRKKGGIARRGRGGAGGADDYDPLAPVMPISLSMPMSDMGPHSDLFSKGLGYAMVQTNGEAMDAELANQDLQAIEELDMEFKEESLNTMVQMLRVLLMRQMATNKIPEEDLKAMMNEMQENVNSLIDENSKNKQKEEDELKRKYRNDPDKLDDEIEKVHSKYSQNMNNALTSEKERIRRQLGQNSNLSEEEVDAIMGEFSANMSSLEKKQSAERAKQAAALEDRLARRTKKVQMHINDKESERAEVDYRRDVHDKKLTELVDDGKMNEKQKQDILDEYETDLRRIQMQHEEEIQRQKLKLAEELERRRKQKMQRVLEAQEEERAQFTNASEGMKSSEKLVDGYHKMLQNQRQERQDQEEELDREEAEEINKLAESHAAERQDKIQDREKQMYDTLRAKVNLDENEASRIMQQHDQDMDEYERIKQDERHRMKEHLNRQLDRRRQRAAEKAAEANMAEERLVEQQDSTINKVLASQLDLDKDVKDKILEEHSQQMNTVNNQLQMSRLRQQKQMEKKLAARKAKMGEIREKQEQAKILKAKDREKELARLQKQLDEEEDKIREDRAKKLEALRKRLAEETEQAIQEQEKQVGLVIGRLQAGKARRAAIISRNEKNIEELEKKMKEKVEEKAEDEGVDEGQVNQLLQQHENQVNALTNKLNEDKARQDAAIKEKIEAKKLKKQQTIERNLDQEVKQEWKQQKKTGASTASAILTQSFMDQKHKMLMDQLENDMHVEMMKQRDKLDEELEQEMKHELEEQKKSFLAQLAAVSNISKAEMTDIVDNAVYDAGGTQKDARRLSKQMTQGLTRAKSSVGGRRRYDEEEEY